MYRQFISLLFFVYHFNSYECTNCIPENNCRCIFSNGSVIDLSTLDNHAGPRFKDIKPSKSDNFTYSYNLCHGFDIGPVTGGCIDVAVCQSSVLTSEYNNIGYPDGVQFTVVNDALKLDYSAPDNRYTTVHLICNENAIDPTLVVNGKLEEKHYVMTLTSRCACPGLCNSGGLSAGSVLVILFMIFVVLYLVLGIIHSSLTRGASGWELIPHYEFWADFPLLVRDGCVFVVSSCIGRNASYGSI